MNTFNKKLSDLRSKISGMERDMFELMTSEKYDLTQNSLKVDRKVGFSKIFEAKEAVNQLTGSLNFFEEKMSLLVSVLNMMDEFYIVETKVTCFDLYNHITEFRDPDCGPRHQIFTNKEKAVELLLDINEKYSNANYIGPPYKLFKYNKTTGLFEEVVI